MQRTEVVSIHVGTREATARRCARSGGAQGGYKVGHRVHIVSAVRGPCAGVAQWRDGRRTLVEVGREQPLERLAHHLEYT